MTGKERRQKRLERILELRAEGKLLRVIGEEVGLTKQRVSLILRANGHRGNLYRRWKYSCVHCGRSFLTIYRNYPSNDRRNRFCSRACGTAYSKPMPIPLGFEIVEGERGVLGKVLTS